MGNNVWHVYDGVAQGENYALVTIGPVAPGESRADNSAWETPLVTSIDGEPVILEYRAHFDHPPTEAEQIELVPDQYREKYLAWLAQQEAPSDSVATEAAVFPVLDEEERVALNLAILGRIDQLSTVRDRTIVSRGGLRMVEACEDQISALTKIYNRLGLVNRLWDF